MMWWLTENQWNILTQKIISRLDRRRKWALNEESACAVQVVDEGVNRIGNKAPSRFLQIKFEFHIHRGTHLCLCQQLYSAQFQKFGIHAPHSGWLVDIL